MGRCVSGFGCLVGRNDIFKLRIFPPQCFMFAVKHVPASQMSQKMCFLPCRYFRVSKQILVHWLQWCAFVFCYVKSHNIKAEQWFIFYFLHTRVSKCPRPLVHRAWSWNPEWTKQTDNHKPDTSHLSGFWVSLAHSDKESLVVLDILFSVPLWLPSGQTNQWMVLFTVILLIHLSSMGR